MFSKRTAWSLDESGWARAAAAARSRGAIDLTETNPTRCGFRYLSKDLLKPFADSSNLLYTPDPCGLLAAREAIGEYYRDRAGEIPADRFLLTSGTSEAYSFLLKLLADPGETVLVPEPGYPLLDHVAQLSDVQLGRYPLCYDEAEGWTIDRARLSELLDAGVRAVVVVHPNNPTGHWTSEGDCLWLEEQAAERGIALISDEVFLDFSFDSRREPVSFTANRNALTFTLSGISKVLGLPQMKISWIAVSGPGKQAGEAMARLAVIADAFLTVSGPPQRALAAWLSGERIEAAQDEINTRIRRNRAFLEKALTGTGVDLLRADGGWQAVIRCRGQKTDEELSLEAMEKGVLVLPGYLFDLPERHLVVSLLPPEKVFQEGTTLLKI